jgi:hypothetical protein
VVVVELWLDRWSELLQQFVDSGVDSGGRTSILLVIICIFLLHAAQININIVIIIIIIIIVIV